MLAKKLNGVTIQCIACNRKCKIKNHDVGFCGVRTNENRQLKLMVYGKPCAVWADPIEKKPLFHFLPGTRSFSIGTFGCNFACEFCQNSDISQAAHLSRVRDPKHWREYFQNMVDKCKIFSPENVVDTALKMGCKSISFTYNEPTIFTEYALDVMKLARKKGLKGVYVTNGYESKECWDAIKGHIDAVNIDLKAYNQKFYTELCKVPKFEYIKKSIEYAKKLGIWVEVTTLLIPGWNDNEQELQNAAEWLCGVDAEMPWHITAFHPDYKMRDAKRTTPEILIKAREIGKNAGLKYVYCGNVSLEYYSYETTFCPHCNKKIIMRIGFETQEINIIDGNCRFCKKPVAGVWE